VSAERARPALRAIRHEPLLLDDRLVAERLDGVLPAETARWARAWLVCWFATLSADDRFGRVDPWELPVRLESVPTPKGGGDSTRQRAVLAGLVDAGVASVREEARGRRGGTEWIAQLARDVFTEHQAGLAIDWATAVARCGGEPAALLVLRALAELIVPLDGAAAVPRRDLMARTGYQQKQVRVAVRRLIAADLVAADGDVGTTARYRLTARALGRAWPDAWPETEAPPVPPPGPTARPAAEPPQAAASSAAPNATPAASGDGVRLLIGGASVTIAPGASFEIGAGVQARLEIGPDGAPRLVVG
jgi:DNA-binding transcriptional ArsR family regulator